MPNHPTNPPNGRRPAWRVLLLDRDGDDPKWILTTVASPADVRPARPSDSKPDDVTAAWAAGQGTLTPLPRVLAWRVDRP